MVGQLSVQEITHRLNVAAPVERLTRRSLDNGEGRVLVRQSAPPAAVVIRDQRGRRVRIPAGHREARRDRRQRCPEGSRDVDGDFLGAAFGAAFRLQVVRDGQLDHVRLDVPVSLVVT